MKRPPAPALLLPLSAWGLMAALGGDCQTGKAPEDLGREGCCHYPDGSTLVGISRDDCEELEGAFYDMTEPTDSDYSEPETCADQVPARAVCCADPGSGEGYIHFGSSCEPDQEVIDPFPTAGSDSGSSTYEQWVRYCLDVRVDPSSNCDLPADQETDEYEQASFDFRTADSYCATAPGYTGAALTLDAPADGGAYTPGFSTANGWVVVASSHGEEANETYFYDLPLGERVSVTVQDEQGERVSVEFTLGDPVTVHKVTWPDGSTSGQ